MKMIKLILTLSLIFNFVGISYIINNYKLKQEIVSLKEEMNKISAEAWADCRTMIAVNRRFEKIEGCYFTVKALCSRTSKYLTCVDNFIKECENL